jgi:tRNA pseudouridine65 synthase
MIEVLYQDDALLAVSKPPGILVHPTPISTDRITLLDQLRQEISVPLFPVHRLDRATSGVLIFALTSHVAASLCKQFAERTIQKTYQAIARGYTPLSETIDYALQEDPDTPFLPALTHYQRLHTVELPYSVGRYPTARYSLIELAPVTGRYHQIRRHMAHVRHPVIGDTAHGDGRHNRFFREQFGIQRLLLHATSLSLRHPILDSTITFKAPLPSDFQVLITRFGW